MAVTGHDEALQLPHTDYKPSQYTSEDMLARFLPLEPCLGVKTRLLQRRDAR